jgi:CheY-like chemotaxis protein
MVQPFRVLVADPHPPTADLIARTVSALRASEIVRVGTAEAAQAKLADAERPFDLMFAAADLRDLAAPNLVRWIRTDDSNCRPNMPVVMLHDPAMQQTDADALVNAGTRLLLKRPLTSSRIIKLVDEAAGAYAPFIVSPSYIGPDRRGAKRPTRDERRITRSSAVLFVEDPTSYQLLDDTVVVVFDYLRLRVSGADARSFRDFLTREHLRAAMANVAATRQRILVKTERQHGVLESSLVELDRGGDRDHLSCMHRASWDVAVDCASAGWILMGSIAKSLHHSTSGAYRPSKQLVRFLGSHVVALKTALVGRIFDDGGRIGKEIVQTIRSAELVFRRAAASAAGGD